MVSAEKAQNMRTQDYRPQIAEVHIKKMSPDSCIFPYVESTTFLNLRGCLLGSQFNISKSTGVDTSQEEQKKTNINTWNTSTNGRHSQKDPPYVAEGSLPPFPQDCGMDLDSGELLQGKANSDSMLELFL